MAAPTVLPRIALACLATLAAAAAPVKCDEPKAAEEFEPVAMPDWVRGVTKMVYITPGEVDLAAKVGAQVVHTNIVWPYYPLRRDGGGLSADEGKRLREFVAACHAKEMKVILGLPPFPSVDLVRAHPDWRVHPDDEGSVLKVEPREDNLGTRVGCNQGPWGDYLVDLLAELMEDYDLDGYSFDGNYHPPLCFCPACKASYRTEKGADLPPKVDLRDVAYREYLVWRGEKLEGHYRRMQERLKGIKPDAVVMSWTTNAGRYGHLLTSPRVMPTRMNLLFDLPMQEWWLDETNFGASVAPSFGAAYLRGIMGGRPNASEPYLMSRGNPYGSDSFPRHERIARALLAVTHGSLPPQANWLPDEGASMAEVFGELDRRAEWLTDASPVPWAAMLVSEQTRQFHAFEDIAERFLPNVFGVFRTAMEEHHPLDLINDWDLTPERLGRYRVLVLPGAAAMSDAQVEAVRRFVRDGGGLVATGETSLCDQLGRPRQDFALADVFGVSYRGHPAASAERPALDENFRVAIDESYWRDRTGAARLTWGEHEIWSDSALKALVPRNSAIFKGPLVVSTEPADASEVVCRYTPEDRTGPGHPAVVVREFGEGRVVYLAAGLDAALWSYAYPYQRRMMARAIEFAAGGSPSIKVEAPMCVQSTFFEQGPPERRRTIVHLFNDVNTAGGHGLPRAEVPLREETIPIHGIRVRFRGSPPGKVHVEPGGKALEARQDGGGVVYDVPPLERQALLVAEPPAS